MSTACLYLKSHYLNLNKMDIEKELQKRILVIDGAMGTMIQRYQPDRGGFSRGTF